MQILLGSRNAAIQSLNAHGVVWQEIDLGNEGLHDYGLYFCFFFTFGAGGFRSNELERVQDSIPWVKEVFQNPVRL